MLMLAEQGAVSAGMFTVKDSSTAVDTSRAALQQVPTEPSSLIPAIKCFTDAKCGICGAIVQCWLTTRFAGEQPQQGDRRGA